MEAANLIFAASGINSASAINAASLINVIPSTDENNLPAGAVFDFDSGAPEFDVDSGGIVVNN